MLAHRLWGRFTAAEGVVFIGRAQEKTGLFRTRKASPRRRGLSMDGGTTGVANQFYFYCKDADFGPFFIKFGSYFPYTAKVCINGHHWAQRQAANGEWGSPPWTTASSCWRPRPVAGHLQPTGTRAIEALSKVVGGVAASVHRRRPGRRIPLRNLDPAGRVLADPDARPPGVWQMFFEEVIRDNSMSAGRTRSLTFDRKVKRRGRQHAGASSATE